MQTVEKRYRRNKSLFQGNNWRVKAKITVYNKGDENGEQDIGPVFYHGLFVAWYFRRVYGVLRPDGNYHCYNVIGDCVFDLTSEQFGEEVLVYENNPEQVREVHFAKEEKQLRYEYLKEKLEKRCVLT